jgi:hypothetical protein
MGPAAAAELDKLVELPRWPPPSRTRIIVWRLFRHYVALLTRPPALLLIRSDERASSRDVNHTPHFSAPHQSPPLTAPIAAGQLWNPLELTARTSWTEALFREGSYVVPHGISIGGLIIDSRTTIFNNEISKTILLQPFSRFRDGMGVDNHYTFVIQTDPALILEVAQGVTDHLR